MHDKDNCPTSEASMPGGYPQPGMPMQTEMRGGDFSGKKCGPDMGRKKELMTLAMSIAAQVQASTRRGEERCMLRQMVEIFLDN